MSKKIFNTDEILEICKEYNSGMSTIKLGIKYNVSKVTIRKYILEYGNIRSNNSNGKKILLSESEKKLIKKMYISNKENTETISKKIGYSKSFIEKFLHKNKLSRTK